MNLDEHTPEATTSESSEPAAMPDGIQRRENVRVNIKIPVTIQIPGFAPVLNRTRDLSATGVGFATRLPLEVDMRGRVTIPFGTWTFTSGFIVRFCRPILAGKQVGAEFEDLTDENYRELVKEVFAVQRGQLKH